MNNPFNLLRLDRYFRKYNSYLLICLSLVTSSKVSAEHQITLFGDLSYSDNGFRTQEDQTGERISEYGARVSASNSGALYDFGLGYNGGRNEFQKGSQEDRTYFIGDGYLRLGAADGVLALDLSHSRQLTLIDPSVADTLQNNDERGISTAVPRAKFRLSKVDNILLSGTYSEVNYKTQKDRSSKLYGRNIQWIHALSAVTNLGLIYGQSETVTDIDTRYDYEHILVNYESKLRNIEYYINFGYNRSNINEEVFEAPRFDVKLNYSKGRNSFELSMVSLITNTSLGNSNRKSLGGDNATAPGGKDTSLSEVDIYRSNIFEIMYGNQINRRLSGELFLGAEKTEYQFNDIEDSKTFYSRLSLEYLLSKWASLSYDYGTWKLKPENDEAAEVENSSHRFSFDYMVSNSFEFSLYLIRDKWEAQSNSLKYTENIIGFRFDYSLF